jgi:hypothetical protein
LLALFHDAGIAKSTVMKQHRNTTAGHLDPYNFLAASHNKANVDLHSPCVVGPLSYQQNQILKNHL